MPKLEEVVGERVTLRFEASKCIHSRGCVLSRPDVFVPNVAGEWIHPRCRDTRRDHRACPWVPVRRDHVLAYRQRTAGEATDRQPRSRARERSARISRRADDRGRAGVTCARRSAAAVTRRTNRTATVRTGRPTFVRRARPAVKDSPPLAKRDGVLKITPTEDGPLLLAGNFELVSGTRSTRSAVHSKPRCVVAAARGTSRSATART